MTKALILDADGMIVHGERFSNRLAREYGISTEVTGPVFRNEFQLCVVGKLDLKKELRKYLKQWGWKDGVDAFLDCWFSEKHTAIDKRFKTTIQALRAKGVKIYLATNNEKYRTDNLVEKRGLSNWFDGVFSSAYVSSKKPDAAFFQYILEKTGMKKEAVVFWDDDVENTEGAAAFGFRTELYQNFEQFKEKAESY